MNNLRYVNPVELHDYWDLIHPGLEVVRRKAPNGWRCEDVYSSIRTNQHTTLHIAEDEAGEYLGFVVLCLSQTWEGFEMNVWIAYSAIRGKQPILDFQGQITAIAKRAGARRIRFDSPRKGWEKQSEVMGFKPLSTIYTMEI